MQNERTKDADTLNQALPVATSAQQIFRILRNTCYFLAVCGPFLLLMAIILHFLSLLGLIHISIRWAFFKNMILPIGISLILAKVAQLLYGGQRFCTVADRPSKHKKSRLGWLISAFFMTLIALCFSVVTYDSNLSVPLVKIAAIINGIALICNIGNTIVQAVFVREGPDGIADTVDTPVQLTSLWNALNLWGWLLILEKFIF